MPESPTNFLAQKPSPSHSLTVEARWGARFVCALAIAGVIGITGCASDKNVKKAQGAVRDYFDGDFARSIQTLQPLANKTDENYVLNNLRLGAVALTAYDLDDAEAAYVRAWEVINAGGVNSGGRAVAATWIDEKLKIWKGEPYERAIASFHLGLIYYMRHDYNNARACFENALFKLRDYASDKDEKKGYTEQESTFVLAHIMLGRCELRLGREDLAKMQFDQAIQLQPRLASLTDCIAHASSNLLLVVEYGYGPKKVTDFDGAIVGFAPSPYQEGPIPLPTVLVNGQTYHIGNLNEPTIDTLSMALDRRWQSIDTIRTVKSALGTGLIAGGAGYGLYKGARGDLRGQDVAIAGGLIVAGALLKATSQADVRGWEMVPRTVFLLPMKLPPGTYDIEVQFPGAGQLRQAWRGMVVPDEGEATYYFRMNRWWPGPFNWPPVPVGRPVSP